MMKIGSIRRLNVFLFLLWALVFVGETDADAKLVWDQVEAYIRTERDYGQMFADVLHQLNEPSEGVSKQMGQMEKRVQNILSWSNTLDESNRIDFTSSGKTVTQAVMVRVSDQITKLMNLLPKSIRDQFNAVELRVRWNLVFSFVETGIMIDSLLKTSDIIEKSQQFRQSPSLQKRVTKLKDVLSKAEQLYQAADQQMDQIERIFDSGEKQITLKKLALDLETANLKCQQAQLQLEAILNDIRQHMKELAAAKANHGGGFLVSTLRFFHDAANLILQKAPSSGMLAKLVPAANVLMHGGNVVGHAAGFVWTRNEIQQLEKHQAEFKELEAAIKRLFADIDHGLQLLEKIQQHM